MTGQLAELDDTRRLEKQISGKIDRGASPSRSMTALTSGATFVPTNLDDCMELAKMMSVSGIAVREHLRKNPGACLAIAMQAYQWGMNPFQVANKSYAVNNQIAYESQLITAVLNTRAPIKGRIKYEYDGEGQTLQCRAFVRLKDDDDIVEVWSPLLRDINPKNSPLWKSDPEQQLAYYTSRQLARRHFPEVLLGVYAEDELRDVGNYQLNSDGTTSRTSSAPSRPKRSDYTDAVEVEEVEPFQFVDRFGEVLDEPLDDREFAGRILMELADCQNGEQVTATLDANSDAIQRLEEHQKTNIQSALEDANRRVRASADEGTGYPSEDDQETADDDEELKTIVKNARSRLVRCGTAQGVRNARTTHGNPACEALRESGANDEADQLAAAYNEAEEELAQDELQAERQQG